MDAGWAEPGALPSEAALGGLDEWDRRRPRRSGAAKRRLLLAALAAALLAAGVATEFFPDAQRRAEAPATISAAPAREFQPRSDLPPLLYVKALDGGQAAAAYEAETRASDGARKDALTLGDPFSDGPFLRASLRIGGAASGPPLFFVEIARQAAEIGQAVGRASDPPANGAPILYSDVTLEAAGAERACLGFRFNSLSLVDLSGLACAGAGRPLDRASLECLVSRIAPTTAGAAAGLDGLNGLAGPKSGC